MNDLEFAALMCSRLCHDLISPVAALSNGLEVLEEDTDQDMHDHALELIKLSAAQASAKLAYARLAFGASSSQGAVIDMAEAGKVSEGLFAHHKAVLTWDVKQDMLEKDAARLLLNLLLIAADAAPRGGAIRVYGDGLDGAQGLGIEVTAERVILPETVEHLLAGTGTIEDLDPRGVQPFLTARLVATLKATLDVRKTDHSLILAVKKAA